MGPNGPMGAAPAGLPVSSQCLQSKGLDHPGIVSDSKRAQSARPRASSEKTVRESQSAQAARHGTPSPGASPNHSYRTRPKSCPGGASQRPLRVPPARPLAVPPRDMAYQTFSTHRVVRRRAKRSFPTHTSRISVGVSVGIVCCGGGSNEISGTAERAHTSPFRAPSRSERSSEFDGCPQGARASSDTERVRVSDRTVAPSHRRNW